MKFKDQRIAEAKERQEEYQKLTPKQKLMKLDLKLGGGVGAKKQRARIEHEIQTAQIPEGVGDSVNKPEKKKPYQKPKRS